VRRVRADIGGKRGDLMDIKVGDIYQIFDELVFIKARRNSNVDLIYFDIRDGEVSEGIDTRVSALRWRIESGRWKKVR
jgi:hypothetical protein